MANWLVDRLFIKQPRLRRWVTNTLYGDRDVDAVLCGTTVRINTLRENGYFRASRLAASSSLLRDELSVLLALGNLVGDGISFVDVGANIGVYSSLLARYCSIHPTFTIHAFEVHPETFVRLAANAQAHGFAAHNVAIGAVSEEAEFVGGAVSHVTTRSGAECDYNIPEETFTARIEPLSAFQIEGRVILKIDVEGQELAVLQGARQWFEEGRIRCVYIDGFQDIRCWQFLQEYDFRLFDGRTLQPASVPTFSALAIEA